MNIDCRPFLWHSLFRSNAGLAMLLAGLSCFGGATNSLPRLQLADEIRSLSPAEAERHYPVRLRGTVTYYDHIERYHFI